MIDAIKWPLAALLAFLLLLVFFRPPITALINRIRSIKRDGIDTGHAPPQSESVDQSSIDALKKTFDSPFLLELEAGIRKDLLSRKLDLSAPAVEILIRHLAQAQMHSGFEGTYRVIFGSQIRILKEANSPTGFSIDLAKQYFGSIGADYEQLKDYPFSEYIGFMLNHTLILERNGYYLATIRGQAFLEWLVRTQLTERKEY